MNITIMNVTIMKKKKEKRKKKKNKNLPSVVIFLMQMFWKME